MTSGSAKHVLVMYAQITQETSDYKSCDLEWAVILKGAMIKRANLIAPVCMRINVHTSKWVWMCAIVCMCKCVIVCMCMCVYACMDVCACAHVHGTQFQEVIVHTVCSRAPSHGTSTFSCP